MVYGPDHGGFAPLQACNLSKFNMDPDWLWQSEMLELIEENLPKKRPTIKPRSNSPSRPTLSGNRVAVGCAMQTVQAADMTRVVLQSTARTLEGVIECCDERCPGQNWRGCEQLVNAINAISAAYRTNWE